MRILGIHHLTLAVRDIDDAAATFEALFGVAATDRRPVPAFGIQAADVPLGDARVELAAPLDPDNPVRRFLERKGEGFYTLALEVDDIQAAARELAARGVRVSAPVESEPGLYSSFVAMSSTHGLSIQLVQVAGSGAAPPHPRTARDDPRTTAAPTFRRPPPPSSGRPTAAAPPPDVPDAPARVQPPDDLPDGPGSPDAAPPVLDLAPDEWSDTD